MIGILLSIVFPGLGQIYFGKKIKGLIMILLAITPLYPIILGWSIWDSIKLRNTIKVEPIKKKEAIFAIILFLIIIPLFSLAIFYGSYLALDFLSNKYIKQRKTQKELQEISRSMDKSLYLNNNHP